MDITITHAYEAQLSTCRKCAAELCKREVDPTSSAERVEPRPIVRDLEPKPFMLIGQAPGLTEYQQGKPFSGQAGADVRRLFEECGVGQGDFDGLVHSSAVAKCYPGSRLVKKGDRVRREDLKPSTTMIRNCSSFMEEQLRIVNPKVIVLLGKMPLEAYLQWKTGKVSTARLADWVGRADDWNGRQIIPLAHTSGLSTWLNSPGNKTLQGKAKSLVAAGIAAVRGSSSL